MKKAFKKITQIGAALGLAFVISSCENDLFSPKGNINDDSAPQGQLQVKMTDAPVDNAEVQSVFVTVTEVKVDGNKFEGFQGPKTVNVLSLQNGATFDLGSKEVAANSYSNLELVLDIESDASGTGPGCYVQKSDGTKDKLELGSSSTFSLNLKPESFDVAENANTTMVVDFDLRKTIESNNGNYSFVSKSQIENRLRVENTALTGEISGRVSNYNAAQSNLVVYVYNKGTFNQSSEVEGKGEGEIKFPNAVTSAKVDASGNYMLSFLQEGEYEVICSRTGGGSTALGLEALLDITGSVDLSNVRVDAQTQTKVDLQLNLDSVLPI